MQHAFHKCRFNNPPRGHAWEAAKDFHFCLFSIKWQNNPSLSLLDMDVGVNQRAFILICRAQTEGMREGLSDQQPQEIRKNSIMVVLSLKLISCPNEISEANLTKRLSVYLDDMIHIFPQSNLFLGPLFSNFLSWWVVPESTFTVHTVSSNMDILFGCFIRENGRCCNKAPQL